MFSGSYSPEDVVFLLKPVRMAFTPVEEKERLIQSGQRHYSEMLSREGLPSAAYLDAFYLAMEQQRARLARHLIALAGCLASSYPDGITLVSLARAGTPVGVLIGRILRRHWQRSVVHYSISIIRDRGIDEIAMHAICRDHPAESVAFLDGWTGKGVIARELARAVRSFNEHHHTRLATGLYAVADLSGTARGAATDEDYLIPCSILGCTINGLISRSILNAKVVGPGDFHGCVYYGEYEGQDLSNWFVDTMTAEIDRQWSGKTHNPARIDNDKLRQRCGAFLESIKVRYGVENVNHVKPGIGEATRVLLRRVPDRLLVRASGLADVAHLLTLAKEKRVPVEAAPDLPYQAAALIKEMDR